MKKRAVLSALAIGFAASLAVGGSIAMVNENFAIFNAGGGGHNTSNSFTITANDISAALGGNTAANFSAGGLEFRIEKASVNDGVVTISGGILYNITYSGATKTLDNWHGAGFTSVVFAGYNNVTGGYVSYSNKAGASLGAQALGGGVSEPEFVLDLSDVQGQVGRVHFAMGAEQGVSFTSITYYYRCAEINPDISIDAGQRTVTTANDDSLELTATELDVEEYPSRVITWASSDTDVATVDANGLSAVVRGKSAGTAVITVSVDLDNNGVVDLTDTTTVTVATAYTDQIIAKRAGSRVEGAGIFCKFDASSTGTTVAALSSIISKSNTSIRFETEGHTNAISTLTVSGTDSESEIYLTCGSAEHLDEAFTISINARDDVNSIRYLADFYFENGAEALPLKVTASSAAVEIGKTVSVNASKGFFLSGVPSYAFESSDTDCATVNSSGVVTGIAAGDVTITVTMTLGDDEYVNSVNISVVAGITYHNITFKNTCAVDGAGVTLLLDNSGGELTGVTKSNISLVMKFEGGTKYQGYEDAMNDPSKLNFVEITFPAGELRIYFTLPNGFTNGEDFTHKTYVTIDRGSDVYAGWILITGNKTITSTGGYSDVIS